MSFGLMLFAVGLAGLGLLSLASGDFALNWQPVPSWVPWRDILARASGLVLLIGGVGLMPRFSTRPAAQALTIYVLLWLVLLHLPRVVQRPGSEVVWLGFAEIVTLFTAAWIVLGRGSVRVAQLLYGAALPLIGLSHFVYIEATTDLVPAWLPYRMGLAYLTGAAQIVAGAGVLLSILARPAAILEAWLITSFTLLVWLPQVIAAPGTRLPWTALFISAAIAGAAWIVADSFVSPGERRLPWRLWISSRNTRSATKRRPILKLSVSSLRST